ncbi:helix-turn-helix transcriptional regulator [Nocardiopsis dassonvillei]|uniref:helix-turn-helix domain-containing protein n=1 Tax=Nocardiopsis dassonvillei TaxID=2014 RepID=UPI00200DE754|nr:helix-turn-helix transcriptional regulator [Nocardiopsis dassonvillei]MCK9871184.1 helix-turn-helix transcriptional regulator [Nocardiopsis dassonvillei]
MHSAFWDGHEQDLDSPEYAREFAAESIRISTIDEIIKTLDNQRAAADMSKAALARAIGSDPAMIRRLLSSSAANPTLGTLAEVAAALGMKVVLEPMTAEERHEVTEPMLWGIATKPTI